MQIFIPSVDRRGAPIPQGQRYWVDQCLDLLGTLFGGATAFPPARGVWRDDDNDGALVYDDTVVVFSYVAGEGLSESDEDAVLQFAKRLGRDGNQGEVGVFIDGTYYGFQDFD